jgi:hypothetical protein
MKINEVLTDEEIINESEVWEWRKINQSFNSFYIKEWKSLNFGLIDVQRWDRLGFKLGDYLLAAQWRDHFGLEVSEYWIKELGLKNWKFQQAYYWKINNIKPNNKEELEQMQKTFSGQQLIDAIYPKDSFCLFNEKYNNKCKRRDQIVRLDLNDLNLNCNLNLSDFINLESLNCRDNQLVSLEINNCLRLKNLDITNNQLNELILASNNQLKNINICNNLLNTFNYSILNLITLTDLNLHNNNLEMTDLTVFCNLVNLECLYIGNDNRERIEQGIYNHFHGSLESLQNCTKLKYLNISNTDINAGLEYLSNSFESYDDYYSEWTSDFNYSTELRPNCQLKILEKVLNGKDLANWRDDNHQIIENGKLLSEYKKIKNNLNSAFGKINQQFYWTRSELTQETLTNQNNGFLLWIETKIAPLQSFQVNYYQHLS